MKKALVLSLAAVLCLGVASFAEDLYGTWDTLICFDTETCCPTIDTTLTVNYEICGWVFDSMTEITMAGWIAQSFSLDGQLGLFGISSDVVFNPAQVQTAAFTSWTVITSLNFVGVDLTGTFVLTPGNTSLSLVVDGSASCLDFTGTLTFGDPDNDACDFDWTGVTFVIDFPLCGCANIEATVIFDCDGFVSAEFCALEIAIPGIEWATIDICFLYETQTKSYSFDYNFDLGVEGCLKLLMTTPTNPFAGGITLDGVELDCTIGGVDFIGISYWGDAADDDKPGILAGTPYWEAYQIGTDDDGCCGDFTFDLTLFFLEGGSQLFDIAEIDTAFDIGISDQFTLGMTLDLVLDPALALDWCLHFVVEW